MKIDFDLINWLEIQTNQYTMNWSIKVFDSIKQADFANL